MHLGKQTCVCEIDHCEEDHTGSKRDSEEEKCLELLSGQPVLEILQESIGLEKCKHTWEKKQGEIKGMSKQGKAVLSEYLRRTSLIDAASCRVQSGFTCLRSAVVIFGRNLDKAVRRIPFGCSHRCKRQILQDSIFQMHETDSCKQGRLPLFLWSHFFPFPCHYSQSCVSCLCGEFAILTLKIDRPGFSCFHHPCIDKPCVKSPHSFTGLLPPTAGVTHFQG